VNVTLINPYTCMNKNSPHVGLGYLASSLERCGHKVRVVDLNLVPNPVHRIFNGKTNLYGITVSSDAYAEAQRLTKMIKKKTDAKVVWGGTHCSIMGEDILKENPEIDYLVIGEGEYFTEHLESPLVRMPFRDNLDELPFPDYTLFDSYPLIRKMPYSFISSRGCPYKCKFCLVPKISGRKVRIRSVENCIEEIGLAVKQGFRHVQILDDNFSFYVSRAKEFCREMKKIGITFHNPNGMRADRFDEELAELMRNSGCYAVQFGVESAVPEVFDGIDKGESLEEIEEAVEIAKRVGLAVGCYFIIGLPNSTFEKDIQSLRWVQRHKVRASFGMLVPYPQTPLWNWAKGKLIGSYTEASHFGKACYPIFETEEYPAEEMFDAFLIINLLAGNTLTEEYYRTNGLLRVMPYDLMRRATRHSKSLAQEVLNMMIARGYVRLVRGIR